MHSYLSDMSKDLGGLAETNALNLHFRDYELILFDSPRNEMYVEISQVKKEELEFGTRKNKEEWYIIGTGYIKENGAETRFSDLEILNSLINLSSKIVENNGLKDELAFYDEVKAWCEKFGLPYNEPYFTTKYFDKKGIGGTRAFRLWEFKRRIAVLYDAFQLWYGLTFNDKEKIVKYSSYLIQGDKKLDEQIPFLKESLAYKVWSEMDTEISVRYNKTTDSYEITPHAGSLVSVAYFQLAMLMTNKGEKGVKFCSVCNKLFEIEHRSRKICDNCQREYHRLMTKKSREEKKKRLQKQTDL